MDTSSSWGGRIPWRFARLTPWKRSVCMDPDGARRLVDGRGDRMSAIHLPQEVEQEIAPQAVQEFASLQTHGEQFSAGSLGHPNSCRPCSFYCFSKRGCKKGQACDVAQNNDRKVMPVVAAAAKVESAAITAEMKKGSVYQAFHMARANTKYAGQREKRRLARLAAEEEKKSRKK